jgi:hypothetical protein
MALHAAKALVRDSSSECDPHARAMRFWMVTSGSTFLSQGHFEVGDTYEGCLIEVGLDVLT